MNQNTNNQRRHAMLHLDFFFADKTSFEERPICAGLSFRNKTENPHSKKIRSDMPHLDCNRSRWASAAESNAPWRSSWCIMFGTASVSICSIIADDGLVCVCEREYVVCESVWGWVWVCVWQNLTLCDDRVGALCLALLPWTFALSSHTREHSLCHHTHTQTHTRIHTHTHTHALSLSFSHQTFSSNEFVCVCVCVCVMMMEWWVALLPWAFAISLLLIVLHVRETASV